MVQIIDLTPGNDIFSAAGIFEPVFITAFAGNDDVEGSVFDDVILGNPGNDTLNGGAGNDTVYGGQDNDFISSDSGNNVLLGNLGNDTITSGSGNDTIYGGQEDDVITSLFGNNILLGNLGNDTITSGIGNDTIYGGQGDDVIVSSFGDKLLLGNIGNDTITGGTGNDTIYGGQNDDVITANAGNNILLGNLGNDTINAGDGNDTIFGGAGNDVINVSGGNNQIFAGLDNDTVNGGTGNDEIFGNSGNNVLNGGGGNDTITGGTGNDTINGGAGNDTINLNQGGNNLVVLDQTAGTDTVIGFGTGDQVGLTNSVFDSVGVQEFFVIDGAQFLSVNIPPFPQITDQDLDLAVAALALQFGIITPQQLAGLQPGDTIADLPQPARDNLLNFGNTVNNPQYIPQVTQGQYDNLVDEFYARLNNNPTLEPVRVRFLSVIGDTGTDLYFSSNGDFSTTSTTNTLIASFDGLTSGFTPSNAINLTNPILNINTIPASTQIVPV